MYRPEADPDLGNRGGSPHSYSFGPGRYPGEYVDESRGFDFLSSQPQVEGDAFYNREFENYRHNDQSSPEPHFANAQPLRQSTAGSFYPTETIQAQLHGAPISAFAYDTAYEAVFVASETQSLSRGRFNHRASMLVTHSTVNGSLYSSVAGHPEAQPRVLKALHTAIYCGTKGSASTTPPQHRKVPNHAFRPCYGSLDAGLPDSAAQPSFQMGIRQLLPLGDGYVSSVSPAGVRIHAQGGLQTADFNVEGMICMTAQPNQNRPPTQINVGGVALSSEESERGARGDLLSLDLWQDLRTISSYSTAEPGEANVAITSLATSHARGSVVVGCADGSMRVLDNRLHEIAKLKSHPGGVVSLAVSDDGNLLATAGYGSSGSALPIYGFPDTNIYFNDLRFLGRGGLSRAFTGLNGGPRHLSFLEGSQKRLLAASGQVGGGMEVVFPFQESASTAMQSTERFIVPQLTRGEAITAMQVQGDRAGVGTSKGNILQFRVPEYNAGARQSGMSGMFLPPSATVAPGLGAANKDFASNSIEKDILETPSFDAPRAQLSIEPTVLTKGDGEQAKSIASSYVLAGNPTVSSVGNNRFGPLESDPIVGSSRNEVSDSFMASSTHSVDFVKTIPTSQLEVDLLSDHRPKWVKNKSSTELQANPNKLLYNADLYGVVYKESFSRFKKRGRRTRREDEEGKEDTELIEIPDRYRLSLRPTHKSAAAFSHAEHNSSGLLPGWDYPPTMPNAFVPPVIMLLYFMPEARRALLRSQFADKASLTGRKDGLVSELSFLFQRIDSLSRQAVIFQSSGEERTRLGAWSPATFVACLAGMPEAEQLQILDGSPAAVETPRRPEAFYRFLLYQVDKELGKGTSLKLMDNLSGVDFVSVNEFTSNSAQPTTSSTRAMTVELHYGSFVGKDKPIPKTGPTFGEVLHQTLSRETRLRAFNETTGAYETVVQRRIAITLPKILSLSCACAGRKETEGLFVWRGTGLSQDHWLPDTIEIEISAKGNVLVRELVRGLESGEEKWVTYGDDSSISTAVAGILSKRKGKVAQKIRYTLHTVLSLVRDDLDRNTPDEIISANGSEGVVGHHVLHARVPDGYEQRILRSQREEITSFMSKSPHSFALVNERDKAAMEQRLRHTVRRLRELDDTSKDSNWVMFNGFKVSRAHAEDARAFHVKFKEPCVVVFRDCKEESESKVVAEEHHFRVPNDVICTRSMTNNMRSTFYANQKAALLPGPGDLVAFDAEFVSVQEEVSTLAASGSRVTIQETRHALARLSAIACQTRTVIFDDFVLPLEKVADYLTRFSGIVERDLNPKESQRHLISTRSAYLKLRFLVERGCVFVGHGLSRDFWTANITVPGNQIIDTVEIYHKPAQRYVSLRFLTNFVLKRDLQQEVHDSLEDATAAFELYQKAVELTQKGEFTKLLDDLYDYGQKVDWKLGIA